MMNANDGLSDRENRKKERPKAVVYGNGLNPGF
jgi:hypothetical protein